jgi:hypothetical protein
MTRLAFHSMIEPPWTSLDPVRLGHACWSRAADRFLVVESDAEPLLRFDLYCCSEEHYAFEQACVWSEFIAVGWGNHAYLVHRGTRHVSVIALGSYFGLLYPTENGLLIASGERLQFISPDGNQVWQSDVLGIDGVIVDDVDNELIRGQGEWDPPGGWKPFSVCVSTGRVV